MNYFKKHYSIIIVALMILFAIICGAYIYQAYDNSFNHHISPIPTKSNDSVVTLRAEWGQLGDFFGGTLNPIFGFLSFVGLLLTLVIQIKSLEKSSEELELSREELAKSSSALAAQNKAIELQSFEQTFFSWLETYQSLLNSIEDENIVRIGVGEREIIIKKGRSQLFQWWKNSLNEKSIWDIIRSEAREGNTIPESSLKEAYQLKPTIREEQHFLLTIANLHRNYVIDLSLATWNKLYLAKEYQLDNLFRTLYRLLILIDSQQESRLTIAQKWLYISIIRSQLSWIEMVYLYFNGLSDRGKKFKLISEKYALFDNLTFESDGVLTALKLYLIAPRCYEASAFNSEIARRNLGLPMSSEETLSLATTTYTC